MPPRPPSGCVVQSRCDGEERLVDCYGCKVDGAFRGPSPSGTAALRPRQAIRDNRTATPHQRPAALVCDSNLHGTTAERFSRAAEHACCMAVRKSSITNHSTLPADMLFTVAQPHQEITMNHPAPASRERGGPLDPCCPSFENDGSRRRRFLCQWRFKMPFYGRPVQ